MADVVKYYTTKTLIGPIANRPVITKDLDYVGIFYLAKESDSGAGSLSVSDGENWLELGEVGEGAPPSGVAGGDLGGTYPNPTVDNIANLPTANQKAGLASTTPLSAMNLVVSQTDLLQGSIADITTPASATAEDVADKLNELLALLDGVIVTVT